MTKQGMLIVISGPSGVGKDTIMEEFMKTPNNCEISVSATTRSPRGNELNGVDYFFLTKEEFQQRIDSGDLLEYAEYGGNYYGTLKNVVETQRNTGKHVILIIETKGARKVKDVCPDAVFIFVMPPSFECLEQRLTNRKTESNEAIQLRLKIASGEIEDGKWYDYIMINEDLGETAEKLRAIITAAECSPVHTKDMDLLKGDC